MSSFKQKYPIVQRFLTGPSKRRPCIPLDPCRFMVAHDTGNPSSTAIGNVAYYERSRNDMEASAHIFVDDVEIIECIPFLTADPEKAWHVIYDVPTDNQQFGDDANDAAGGIELCYGGGMDLYQAYKRYVWVLAYSCYRYDLDPTKHITGHYILDPQRKVDPMSALRLLGKSFEDLIQDVVNEYNDCLQSDEPKEDLPEMETKHATLLIGLAKAAWREGVTKIELEDGSMQDITEQDIEEAAREARRVSGLPEG